MNREITHESGMVQVTLIRNGRSSTVFRLLHEGDPNLVVAANIRAAAEELAREVENRS